MQKRVDTALANHIRFAYRDFCADVNHESFTLQLWHCQMDFYTQTFSWISRSGSAGKLSWTGPWAKDASPTPLCAAPTSLANGSNLTLVDCMAAPFFELTPGPVGKHIRLQDAPHMCLAGKHWPPFPADRLHLWHCYDLLPEQVFIVPSAWSGGLKDGQYYVSPTSATDAYVYLNSFAIANGGRAYLQAIKIKDSETKTAASQWTVTLSGPTTITLQSRDHENYYIAVVGDAVGLVEDPTDPSAQWVVREAPCAGSSGVEGSKEAETAFQYRFEAPNGGQDGSTGYLALSKDFTNVFLQWESGNQNLDDGTAWKLKEIPVGELAKPSVVKLNPRVFPISAHIEAIEHDLAA